MTITIAECRHCREPIVRCWFPGGTWWEHQATSSRECHNGPDHATPCTDADTTFERKTS